MTKEDIIFTIDANVCRYLSKEKQSYLPFERLHR